MLAVGQGSTATATDLAANQATDAIRRRSSTSAPLHAVAGAGARGDGPEHRGGLQARPFGVLAGEVTKTETPAPASRSSATPTTSRTSTGTPAPTWWGLLASAQDRMFFMDVLRHTGRGA